MQTTEGQRRPDGDEARRVGAVGVVARWGWMLILLIGVVISLSMTVVTASLAWTVAQTTLSAHGNTARDRASDAEGINRPAEAAGSESRSAALAAASPPSRAALPTGSRANGEDDAQTVNSSMTAVSTAVAAMTLVLSVGTTWFAKKYQEVDRLGREVERRGQLLDKQLTDQRKRFNELQSEQQRQQLDLDTARARLVRARLALRRWIDSESGAPDRYSIFNELAQHLEALQVRDLVIRREAFEALSQTLPSVPCDLLRDVQAYVLHCHTLHCPDVDKVGIMCDIFSATERCHLANNKSAGQNYY